MVDNIGTKYWLLVPTLMNPDARYWNPAIESQLGTEAVAGLQLERLQQRISALFEHAPYFRRRMETRGAAAKDVRSLEDWAKAMPVFTKADYRELIEACDNDVYRFLDETLPVPIDEIVCMAATSGT